MDIAEDGVCDHDNRRSACFGGAPEVNLTQRNPIASFMCCDMPTQEMPMGVSFVLVTKTLNDTAGAIIEMQGAHPKAQRARHQTGGMWMDLGRFGGARYVGRWYKTAWSSFKRWH